MNDLAAFIAACYDEAEALAKAAGGEDPDDHRWHQTDPDWRPGWIEAANGNVVVYDEGSPDAEQAAFIADMDPKHRLADIALKRAILADAMRVFGATDDLGAFRLAERTVRQLGTEFAAHPGYNPSWAPEASHG